MITLNNIYLGDSLELIKQIKDESIDAVLTDPPYGLGKEDINNDESLDTFYNILPELYRVLKPDSYFATYFSIEFLPKAFINNPFEYFWQVITYLPFSKARNKIGFCKYYTCLIFKKGNPKRNSIETDAKNDNNFSLIEPTEGFIDHPTVKSRISNKHILNIISKEDDIVLDPFMGSGSTIIACKELYRQYVGIEINEKYFNIAKERIRKNKIL